MNIIEIKNLKKSFNDYVVFDNLSLEIEKSKITFVAGGSGCGKSVLMRQIIGLDNPDSGEIFFFGLKWSEKADYIKTKFNVLFQQSGLISSMTLAENIALLLMEKTKLTPNNISKIIDIKLESVGLEGFRSYLPSEISGGMKKRAAIARSMALDPEILFLDEPNSGLDPITSAEIDKLIKDLNTEFKTTMIVISHDLDSIKNISDYVFLLDKSVKGLLEKGIIKDLQISENKVVSNFFSRKI